MRLAVAKEAIQDDQRRPEGDRRRLIVQLYFYSGYEVAAGTFVCANILEYIYISSSTLSLSTLSVGQLMVGVMSFHKTYDLIG